MDIDKLIPGRAIGNARALLHKVVDLARTALTPSSAPRPIESVPVTRPMGAERSAEAQTASSVTASVVEPSKVLVSWKLDAEAVDQARTLLGSSGTLCARLVVVRRDATSVVRSDVTDRSHVQPEGEWLVPDLPSGAYVAAAVGVQHGERFVSAGHASRLFLP